MTRPKHEVIVGDALTELKKLESDSVDCIVTSPPYFGLRDYGIEGQIGCDHSLEEYLERLRSVFAECRRVLKPTGTLWLNLGDTYASSWPSRRQNRIAAGSLEDGKRGARPPRLSGLKEKDLFMVPARLAITLQSDGWYLRSDIIWSKPNCMPESCRDRPTSAHEHIFLFVKKQRGYYFDAESIATPIAAATVEDIKRRKNPGGCQGDSTLLGRGAGLGCGPRVKGFRGAYKHVGEGSATAKQPDKNERSGDRRRTELNSDRVRGLKSKTEVNDSHPNHHGSNIDPESLTANARNVWEIPTVPYPKAHFATFPPELPRRCILAGCPVGGLVLDPFAGSGTTLAVAVSLGRRALGIELNPEYVALVTDRLAKVNLPLELEQPGEKDKTCGKK